MFRAKRSDPQPLSRQSPFGALAQRAVRLTALGNADLAKAQRNILRTYNLRTVN